MNIQLEEQNKIIKSCPVFFHKNKEDLFEPALLAVTDSALVVYSDLQPDLESDGILSYCIKARYNFQDIISLVKEKVVAPKKYKKYLRLNLILKDIANSNYFFYSKSDKKRVKVVLKTAKKKIKVLSGQVDLSLDI